MQAEHPRVVDEHGAQLQELMLSFFRRLEDGLMSSAEHSFYSPQLERLQAKQWQTVVVRWAHMVAFNASAAAIVESALFRCLPFLNRGFSDYVHQFHPHACPDDPAHLFLVSFAGVPNARTVRTLRSGLVGQLCSIAGTVTRTSQVRPELLVGVFKCNDCGTESEPIEQEFRYTEPPRCRNAECENKNYWTLSGDHQHTRFGDWQKLRVQENANEIPVGCMPRTMEVVVRDDAVEVAKPGDRVVLTGCPIVVPEVAKLFNSLNRREVQRNLSGTQRAMMDDTMLQNLEGATGLKALGVRDLNYRMCFLATTVQDAHGDERKMLEAAKESEEGAAETDSVHLTPGELDQVRAMRLGGGIIQKLTACVCPNIFKHELVKTGLLLQIIGGVSKRTLEGTHLRGDINVCVIGDPSTAKSQFLKWVSSNVPRGIYTSGKASSASGLTATLTRDADTGERTIEAGALMLADHGVCCIDEFDKMDVKDQVAIHEAMEQQTISIAKAGVKATLNARTSLLAALNPIGGKYDRRKPLQKNIAMTAPIMSRFDLMFCIVDDGGDASDERIANDILSLHRHGDTAAPPPFSPADLQLYIKYAKSLKPRLTADSMDIIVRAYRDLRLQDSLANRSKVYRVTTRLLESIIRLSEATAKVMLADEVRPSHVEVALELMRASLTTIDMTEVEFEAAEEPQGDATDAPAPAAAAPPPEKARRRITIHAEVYNRIVNKLLARVQQLGEAHATASELIEWYIDTLPTTDVEQLQLEARTVRLVLGRMCAEGTLLQLSGEGGQPRLFLDPNYAPAA